MNLGNQIYTLRTARRMSQGDLAEALEVSRQSVSKWETGNATPDLDKLMKMAKLFGVTLDELVSGAQPLPESAPVPAPTPVQSSSQRTWGIALMATGLVAFLGLTFIGGPLVGLIFASPLLVPAIICLCSKKYAGLKCAWAEYFLIVTYLIFGIGTNWRTIFFHLRNLLLYDFSGYNPMHPVVSLVELIVLLVLLTCTVRSYNREIKPLTSAQRKWLSAGWLLYFISLLPFKLPIDVFSIWYSIATTLILWARVILFTVLAVHTWRLPWFRRKTKI